VPDESSTFVLVHGAAHGGWCWRRVADRLSAAGHRVYTPTLTGLGARAHLLSPHIGLDTAVQDVVGVLEYEELNGVVLVGHSFGATVVCGVAARARGHLSALVLLDGLLAQPGSSIMDGLDPGTAAARLAATEVTAGTRTLPPLDLPAIGVTEQEDAAWLRRRLTPHPVRTYTEPLPVEPPLDAGLPCTYVACTEPPYPPVAHSAAMARDEPRWHYRELSTGHDAMITAPAEVAAILLQAPTVERPERWASDVDLDP
jgi:pimeloyl-ACP methyl ester carboxylesterase